MEEITIDVEPMISVSEDGRFSLSYPVIKTDGSVKVIPNAINFTEEELAKRLSEALSLNIEQPSAEVPLNEPAEEPSELVEEEPQEENKEEKENVSTDSESDTTGDSTED
jgi:hypothetical protein